MVNEERDAMAAFEEDVGNAISVKVPPSRKTSLGSAIGFILASFFFMMFILAVSQISGQVTAMVLAAFSIFGWDPIITSFFMAGIFLFLTVTIYLLSKRGSEAVTKMESGLKLMFNVPPTRYFDLSDVPSANIIHELVGTNNPRSNDKGRGCKMVPDDDGSGFYIRCDTIPVTDAMKALMSGTIDAIDTKRKIVIIAVFSLFGCLIGIATAFGSITGISVWILWIIFIVSFFYTMLELRIFKLWGMLLSWAAINSFLTFSTSDMVFLWTMWGALISAFVIGAVFYLLARKSCLEKEAPYCDFL